MVAFNESETYFSVFNLQVEKFSIENYDKVLIIILKALVLGSLSDLQPIKSLRH